MKYDVIDGSVVNRLRQPILYSFVLNKKPGFNVFCDPETVLYEKVTKYALNTITLYLEDDNQKEVDFTGEKLTFTLQKVKS